MSATYDPVTGRVTLAGAPTLWSRTKNLLPVAPVGSDSVIYIMRYWLDELPLDTFSFALNFGHDNAQHIGFNFSENHPNGPTIAGLGTSGFRGVYNDFFGFLQYPNETAGFNDAYLSSEDTLSAKQDYAIFSGNPASDQYFQAVHYGNGDYRFLSSMGDYNSKPDDDMPFTVPRDEITGLNTTYVWQVTSSDVNESVSARCYVNTDGIDLDAINLTSDLDPTNPETLIPVSNSWDSSWFQVNTDAVTSTNWRPSAGVMGFPAYFNARYAHDNYGLIIDYLGVQYSSLYTP